MASIYVQLGIGKYDRSSHIETTVATTTDTAQHSSAQHRTSQHNTAQHTTVQHSTAQGHHSNAKPHYTAQVAGGKRSHDGCHPGTLRSQTFALTRSSRDCPLSPVDLWLQGHFSFFSIIFCTIIPHGPTYVRQCTSSGLPHECLHLFRVLTTNLARR